MFERTNSTPRTHDGSIERIGADYIHDAKCEAIVDLLSGDVSVTDEISIRRGKVNGITDEADSDEIRFGNGSYHWPSAD